MLEIKPIFNALLRSKVGAVLLLIQIAITTAIVSNAAFIINDRINYLNQPTGYEEDNIFKFNVMMFGTDVDLIQQVELDEQTLRQMPGVVDAVHINAVPLSGGGSSTTFRLKPAPEKAKTDNASYFETDEHGLNALGVELIAGRNFTQEEVVINRDFSKHPNVALATKALMDEFFPNGDGLGKTLYMGDQPLKVVGIIGMMKGPWLKMAERKDKSVILPLLDPSKLQQFLVRTEPGQRANVMKQIETVMHQNYAKRVIQDLTGLDKKKANYVAEDLLMMRMLVILISVLVLVTALGIFGLTLFNINKRTKQIGTRRALGARKSAIIKYFVVENSLICIAGLVLGVCGAVFLGQQLMAHYSVPALSYWYVAVTAVAVFAMSLLAVIGPAKRAANIAPSIATRTI
ncbi:ABC transporter permease [Pseudoalteromonas sp. SSM20]|uniref:ABC transporter permease n=1 Tax=Pseudoalteromonas sp. SSM20 TaxID=3139394 RepID=UPI003BA91843